jgi:hypothetical protein
MKPKKKVDLPPPDEGDVKKYTQAQVADMLGYDRTTILRMEQRKELPEPTWVRQPTPRRIYSDNDVKEMRRRLKEKTAEDGRTYIDDGQKGTPANAG